LIDRHRQFKNERQYEQKKLFDRETPS